MRENFPLLEQTIYLNTAYVGLMSQQLLNFRQAYDATYLSEGDQFKIKGYERLASQREKLAAFLGSRFENTFVTPNFSIGFRFVLDALPKSTRILSLKGDYHSLANALNERGLVSKEIAIDAQVEATIESELATGNYDAVALSVVQYTSGFLVDLEALKKIKERYPQILFLADGTQFIGAESFHFESSPLDVITASGYKWLLAGFGNGLVSLSQSFLDFCSIRSAEFEARVYAGHFDFLSTASLAHSIALLEQFDFQKLLESKAQTAAYLRQNLEANSLLDSLLETRSKHASIFTIPGDALLHERLLEEGVRCSLRGKGIRLSVHFYNNEEDIDRFIAVYNRLV